jgi:hypothetical protein
MVPRRLSPSAGALARVLTCWFLTAAAAPAPARAAQAADPSQFNRLSASVERLKQLEARVPLLNIEPAGTAEARKDLVSTVGQTIADLDFMQRESPRFVARAEVIDQLSGNAVLLTAILAGTDLADPRIDERQQETIKAIARDVKRMRMHLEPRTGANYANRPAWFFPTVRVVVTLRFDGVPESNLRVFYIGEAFYGTPLAKEYLKSFDRVGSPSDRELPEGDYRIWAANDGEGRPLSAVGSLQVRTPSTGREMNVDLVVRR